MSKQSTQETILLIGATGHLGGKVAREARRRDQRVRALLRSGSEAPQLQQLGIDIVPGDLRDRSSLIDAMQDCTAVISTAIGYSGRKADDVGSDTDTLGNRNLAEAVLVSRVPRLVFCSILTCDRAKSVPHFWNKKLSEDYFRDHGVPFVALRPGAFLDQGPSDFWAEGLKKGQLRFLTRTDVPFSFIHTDHLAGYLLDACGPSIPNGSVIDISCDAPACIDDLATLMSSRLGQRIKPVAPPWPLVSLWLSLAGLFDPKKRDLLRMMAYIKAGTYLADTTLQRTHFGPPASLATSVDLYLQGLGLLEPKQNSPPHPTP